MSASGVSGLGTCGVVAESRKHPYKLFTGNASRFLDADLEIMRLAMRSR
jgi:hypothetical protein